ncbi:MAG: CsbD family protein [Methylococcales bacterium]
MNWNQVRGNWKEFTGKAKITWAKFTDDELDEVAGKRDVHVGQIQKKYGIAQELAEQQAKDFETAHKIEKHC